MKKRLMAPGPTPVLPAAREALSREIFHHRTAAFQTLFAKVNEDLKYLFQTKNPVVTFASSGTGAMQSAVSSVVTPGDKTLVIAAGKFGSRWAELCDRFGAETTVLKAEPGKTVSLEKVEAALKAQPDTKAVYATLCETSTAVRTDIEALGKLVADTPTLLVVDSVSGLGADDLCVDEWHVDIAISGSQKGLMLPPGLAFAAVSDKARKVIDATDPQDYYFALGAAVKKAEANDTPFTPAIGLIVALAECLKAVREEGIENVVARHARLAEATRAGVTALGLELLSESASNAVTAFRIPDGIDGVAFVKSVRDDLGVTIAGGQGEIKGKIARIAHLGYCDDFDTLTALSAVELMLARMGHNVEFGTGQAAAMKVLANQ
jgi:aspartate aminotransferase-like enzyme